MTILGKNNKITSIILLFLSLSLSSCFDIIHDVTVTENGSGNFGLTANLSKSKSQISKILSIDSIQGFNIPSIKEIDQKLAHLKSELSKIEGITNINITKDFENYIFKLNFDFKHLNDLNKAQTRLLKASNKSVQPISYSYSAKEFLINYTKDLLNKFDNELVKYKLGELESADFITICRFDRQVKSCDATTCKISKNGQTTFNKISASEFIENQKKQSLQIIFK
jgi:hypothetical protein